MNLDIIKSTTKKVGHTIDRNSPTILTALGVGGLASTIALTIKGTVSAYDALYQEANFRMEQWEDQTGEDRSAYPDKIFTTKEVLELSWKHYIPTAIMGGVTIACMIGSNHISLRRNAALVSLLSLTETTLREYQEKVKEQIGEKKAEKIQEDIVQDRLDRAPTTEKAVIFTGKGDYLCYDSFSGRYFRNNIDTLQRIETIFNQRLLQKEWLDINEFYDELGLEAIEMGEEFGWIAERDLMHLRFDTKMATIDGVREPCLVMSYSVNPHHI